jgi:CheY-like chemotaxis protein
VARRLRAMNHGQSFRIVAVTGWGQDADRTKAREAGFDVHLVKPVDLNVLEKVLEERGSATLH